MIAAVARNIWNAQFETSSCCAASANWRCLRSHVVERIRRAKDRKVGRCLLLYFILDTLMRCCKTKSYESDLVVCAELLNNTRTVTDHYFAWKSRQALLERFIESAGLEWHQTTGIHQGIPWTKWAPLRGKSPTCLNFCDVIFTNNSIRLKVLLYRRMEPSESA